MSHYRLPYNNVTDPYYSNYMQTPMKSAISSVTVSNLTLAHVCLYGNLKLKYIDIYVNYKSGVVTVP